MAEQEITDKVLNKYETRAAAARRGVAFRRFFTKSGIHPFDEVEWELRTASIQNEKGRTIFEQRNVEAPKEWSMTATNIVASKYFHGKLGSLERESSVRQLVSRVADTIADWGLEGGYFRSPEGGVQFAGMVQLRFVAQVSSQLQGFRVVLG